VRILTGYVRRRKGGRGDLCKRDQVNPRGYIIGNPNEISGQKKMDTDCDYGGGVQ